MPAGLVTIGDPGSGGQDLAEVGPEIVGDPVVRSVSNENVSSSNRNFIAYSSSWRLLRLLQSRCFRCPRSSNISTG
jgi:hypothetical protein